MAAHLAYLRAPVSGTWGLLRCCGLSSPEGTPPPHGSRSRERLQPQKVAKVPGAGDPGTFPGAPPPRAGGSPTPPASEELGDLLISSRRNRCSCQGGDRCQLFSAWPCPAGTPAGCGGVTRRAARTARPHPSRPTSATPPRSAAHTFARRLLAPPCGLCWTAGSRPPDPSCGCF